MDDGLHTRRKKKKLHNSAVKILSNVNSKPVRRFVLDRMVGKAQVPSHTPLFYTPRFSTSNTIHIVRTVKKHVNFSVL